MVASVGKAAVAQAGLVQIQLQQAQRQADRAEDAARSLGREAAKARSVADRAEDAARRLGIESDRAQTAAGQARQGVAALRTAGQAVDRLSRAFDRVAAGATGTTANVTAPANKEPAVVAPPVPSATVGAGTQVNSQGQTTGRLVDVTA